ncbi:hypothetical protein OV079_42020 [Nannocystis pusilla]|uniref:Uncharacterized protein n=1 Tax=Nannocystis pusilla TaxID=889268 RepID=A0A9X3EYV0_9BACT|nr:hypothetical protein [Nannocystis pusilla]MCY1012015.1 hypothetical protein [Nannocystis pusilla]
MRPRLALALVTSCGRPPRPGDACPRPGCEALAAAIAGCHGPRSDALDLQADPAVPLQRILDLAIAGRRAGKCVGLEDPD